ncbi:MAG: hypothetical protein ACRDTZ_11885 [Pseudonocardiaceae bacterium]
MVRRAVITTVAVLALALGAAAIVDFVGGGSVATNALIPTRCC